MFKKITVLAIAVGVMAALALPASASAVWKHHADQIQTDQTIGLTGQAFFVGTLGGVECQVTSRVKFKSAAPTTTGTAETFVPHPTDATTNCKGQGGLAFCQIHNVVPTELSWTIHTVSDPNPRIRITHGQIHSQASGGFCPVKKITITAGTNVYAKPNQPNTVTSVQLEGQVHVHLETNSGVSHTETHATAGGVLTIEPQNEHTYSI